MNESEANVLIYVMLPLMLLPVLVKLVADWPDLTWLREIGKLVRRK